jgi:outer membrane protein TolC
MSARRTVWLVPLLLLVGCSAARHGAGLDASLDPASSPVGAPAPVRAPAAAGPTPARPTRSPPLATSGASDGVFALGDAIAEAAENNPRLAAARNRWLAATQRPAQARALPDPLLSYTEMVEPIRTRVGPIERDFQVTQKIPYPGKLSAAGAVASEQARVSRLEYDIALRDTVAEIKVSYAELLYLHQATLIIEQNQHIARQLAEKGAALYGGGEEGGADAVTLFDTLKAQSQLAQLAYDLITVQELEAAEGARMNELLGRTGGAKLGVLQDLAYRPLRASQEQIVQLGLHNRQELEAALHRIRAADHARRLARLSRVPDFTVGVKYWMVGEQGSAVANSGEDAVGVTLGVSLPIWARKNSARIAEAEYLKRAACLDRQAEADNLQARIAKVFFKMQNADRLVRLYEGSLIPQAADALEIAEQWRDTGRETFGRLLEAQGVWLNFQLAHRRALADHEQTVARLEQLVGASLGDLRRKEAP